VVFERRFRTGIKRVSEAEMINLTTTESLFLTNSSQKTLRRTIDSMTKITDLNARIIALKAAIFI